MAAINRKLMRYDVYRSYTFEISIYLSLQWHTNGSAYISGV